MAHDTLMWDKAREYFEAGLSLSEIHLKTNISRPQISKRSKKECWEKGNEKKHLISTAISLATKKETLKETALDVHNELVAVGIRRANLVYGASEKLLKQTTSMIDENVTAEKVNMGDGTQKFAKRRLNSSDLKNLSDTIDKASITLGVNQRHATGQVQITNTNAQQNNKPIKIEFVSKTLPMAK